MNKWELMMSGQYKPKLPKPLHIWVVQMDEGGDGKGIWHSTVGIGLNREDGRQALSNWQRRNPCDRFRLARYEYKS